MNAVRLRLVLPIILLLLLGFTTSRIAAQETSVESAVSGRTLVEFDANWRFSKGDSATAMVPGFDDAEWRQVNVPHDWSSEGPFGAGFGSGNGYAPGGIGWYRKYFRLDTSQKGKRVALEFDGVYDYSEVWINGHYVGGRPYGYSSFQCVLTPLLNYGSDENVIAVRVDHSRFADSRWYTGSGIYRRVRLRLTDQLRIGHWGTFVTTPQVTSGSAVVRVETTIENGRNQTSAFGLRSDIITPNGQIAGTLITQGNLNVGSSQTYVQEIQVARPQLWSLQAPALYTLRSRVTDGSKIIDETETRFGIRTLRFDANHGFFLNGESVKLKGVCIHHDAGSLGAAVPDKVLERRLRVLKELGVNAIRTSHNPPAPELLNLCDRLGLLVMDEAFDEFTPAKNKWVQGRNNGEPSHYGYAELFDQWSVTDISDMVRRDRNHPCIIMWSIGNEIDYANDPFSHPMLGDGFRPGNPPAQDLVTCARPLIAAVKRLDSTRPVTAALATVAMSDAVGLGEMLDIVGYNYQEPRYSSDHQKYPQRFIFGSENGDGWEQWLAVRDNDYVAGQFLWTGIDYLGEANRWPNRANGAGLLDLCGFKKPGAWFRQSLWSDQPMVYLCASVGGGGRRGRGRGRGAQESWNWSDGSIVTVRCYTTCPEVVLLLNDNPIGTNRLSDAMRGTLTWQVPFEAGVLKAIGRRNGQTECEFALKTAGSANRIELLPDVTSVVADGHDICHLEFHVVDAQGVRVPDAENELKFSLDGPAKIIGIDNGDLNSPATGKDGVRAAFHGRGLAILQSTDQPGPVRVTARAQGLREASVEIEAHADSL